MIRNATVILSLMLGLLLGSVIAPTPLHAVPPTDMGAGALQFARAGAPKWGHNVPVTTSTGFLAINNSGYSAGNEATLRMVEWGTLIPFDCDAITCACVTMDDDTTIASGTSCGTVTDSGTPPDGVGPCFRVLAGDRRDVVVIRQAFSFGAVSASSTPGYRSSACTEPAALVGYPCDADDDCPTGAAGACSSAAVPKGAFITVIGAGATNCMATEEI